MCYLLYIGIVEFKAMYEKSWKWESHDTVPYRRTFNHRSAERSIPGTRYDKIEKS
jgi:hypothetical protein